MSDDEKRAEQRANRHAQAMKQIADWVGPGNDETVRWLADRLMEHHDKLLGEAGGVIDTEGLTLEQAKKITQQMYDHSEELVESALSSVLLMMHQSLRAVLGKPRGSTHAED